MATITLPSVGRSQGFNLRRVQSALRTVTGVTQITQFPNRLWEATLQVPPQRGALLQIWASRLIQLSDMNNTFAMGPYWYDGPTSGYSGPQPLVMGASQSGSALIVDTVTPSTLILQEGDFLSFDTISPVEGVTNRQLVPVTQSATSNGSGVVTFTLSYPIRQSPADNAPVNIVTPTALFSLDEPIGGVDVMDILWAGFSFKATEHIFP